MRPNREPYPRREVLSGGVVFTQEDRPTGWYNIEARTATPEDLNKMSGSHNRHARLAPSASKRWTTCTASIPYALENADRIPEDRGSIYAQEGTKAHDYAEAVLRGRMEIEEVPDGDSIKDENFPHSDFRTPVKVYTDYCQSITPEGETPFIELQVPLFYDRESTGTSDFVAIKELESHTEVEIVDYKHGAGTYVSPEQNTQGASYGMSTIRDLEEMGVLDPEPDTVIKITIVQPRYVGEEKIRTWELLFKDFDDFCTDEILDPVHDIEAGNTKFAPSEDACKWCPCKGFCKAREQAITESLPPAVDLDSVLAEIDEVDRKAAKGMSAIERVEARCGEILDDETLVAIFANEKNIKSLVADVREYLEARLANGERIEGLKLVKGRDGNRVWADEESADKTLGRKLKQDQRYSKKLITPTQAEKLLSEELKSTRFRNVFEGLVTRSEGQPTIALESDKRDAIESLIDQLPD